MIFCGTFRTQINASLCQTPTLKMNTNTCTVWRIQNRDEFIPQWGPIKLMCLCVCLFLRLSLRISPCIYVWMSVLIFGNKIVSPTIAGSTCVQYIYIYIFTYIYIYVYAWINKYIYIVYIYVTNKHKCIMTLDPQTGNLFALIYFLGIQHCIAFTPQTGERR